MKESIPFVLTNAELDNLSGKVNSLTDTVQIFQTEKSTASYRSANMVIRKLPEPVNENLSEKVKIISN